MPMIPNEHQSLLPSIDDANNKNNHNSDFRKNIISNIKSFLLDFFVKLLIIIPILCICSSAVFLFMSQRSEVPKITKRKYLLIGIMLILAFVVAVLVGVALCKLKRLYSREQATNRPISFISHNEYEDSVNERQSRIWNDLYFQQSRNSARIRALNLWNYSPNESYAMNSVHLADENQRNLTQTREVVNSFYKNVAPPSYNEIYK